MAESIGAEIGTCWWCGNPADSREHKLKRTDIDRVFGGGPYREGRTLVKHQYRQRPSDATGSKSKVFKFEPTICRRCNAERSQPFDSAYDTFMDHIFENESEILAVGEVDMREVYGPDWESKSLDLSRYFVKHICCRLANVAAVRAVWLDSRLVEFLDGGAYPRCLGLATLIDMSVAEWWRAMRLLEEEPGELGSFLHLTGIVGVDRPRPAAIENPEAAMLVEWFGIYWRIADDEHIPNQIAGPVVSFVVTDWHFGSENRLAFAAACEALESSDFDPAGKDFGEIVAEFGARDLSFMNGWDGQSLRPEPSPIGLSGRGGPT